MSIPRLPPVDQTSGGCLLGHGASPAAVVRFPDRATTVSIAGA